MCKENRLVSATFLLIVFAWVASRATASVTFSNPTSYPVGTALIGVAIGDFNGDAKVDLAVVNSGDLATGNDGNVSILLGNGDGSFQPAVNFAAGKNPQSIALDATTNTYSVVNVLLGNGDMTTVRPDACGAPGGTLSPRESQKRFLDTTASNLH